MTSIFSPIGQSLGFAMEQTEPINEEFKRTAEGREVFRVAQAQKDELPQKSRYINDADNPDLQDGLGEVIPRAIVPNRGRYNNVELLQTSRQNYRNELNMYNTPLLRDDQGNIIGKQQGNLSKKQIEKMIEDFISRQTGRDVPEFEEV